MEIDFRELWQSSYEWIITTGLSILVILLLALIAMKVAKLISRRLFTSFKFSEDDIEMKKRADTLGSIIQYVLSFGITLVALIMILGELGIQIGPILATAGVAGLAFGFGAQHLVKDVMTGFFILMDDEIRVGDVVDIAGKAGVVEEVTLRLTVLRDLSGNVHYVPNGHIDIVTNMTKEYSYAMFDIGIGYGEDTDEVVKVIKEVDEDLRAESEVKRDIYQPIEVLGVDQFADSAVVIKARIKTRPSKQWGVSREFNRRLKKAFDAKNIEIPFPHVTVFKGEAKS
jgi:small conductance mechanosensitive channel